MCGLTGFIDFGRSSTASELESHVRRMADSLVHRGPDDSGTFVDAATGVALGFRRLSILDLSPAGHQPMRSPCGRYVIVFNGEMFNFEELRAELTNRGEAFEWKGRSDTEVFLAAISRWGVEPAVQAAAGMFAFALWDTGENTLWLGRDRLGKKPLYYGWADRTFLFGSELKALAKHPAFRGDVDRDALALYLRFNYVPTPRSIYRGIRKLVPGTLLRVDCGAPEARPEPIAYWSLHDRVEAAEKDPFTGSRKEAAGELEKKLLDAVRMRMEADVPLGAFLSGGIDSSLIVALMQAQSRRAVKTFTIGFQEKGFDEAVHAKAVADHLQTQHTELYVTPEEARGVIPRLPILYDEPFGDSSQIPTFLVSQLARREVTVALSGDGGDEVFGGYNRYFWARRIWRLLRVLPFPFRARLAGAIERRSPSAWDGSFETLGRLLPRQMLPSRPADKLLKLASTISAGSPMELYARLCSFWTNPGLLVSGGEEQPAILSRSELWPPSIRNEFTLLMMYLDHLTYLPDDILAKVDRASMGVSLEARAPFLDHRVVEFAWRLPLEMKVRGGQGKVILRDVLYKYVPRELLERPKMGFGVPIDSWLRGPLREWAESLLDETRLKNEGFLRPERIRARWGEHLSGSRNWADSLWGVLMFQAWQQERAS